MESRLKSDTDANWAERSVLKKATCTCLSLTEPESRVLGSDPIADTAVVWHLNSELARRVPPVSGLRSTRDESSLDRAHQNKQAQEHRKRSGSRERDLAPPGGERTFSSR